MGEFKIPPISPLIGSTPGNFLKILTKGNIEAGSYLKLSITAIVILIATPLHVWEYIYYRKNIKKATFKKEPLFILGHWRSGTTLLHNILCQDPNAAYITTYQSVFPNNLKSKWLFKTFMRLFMPTERPSDSVKLHSDYPQEDEFAFSNMNENAYYNMFYFPKNYKRFYSSAIKHEGLTKQEIKEWYSAYDQLLNKALLNTKGERLVIKNPVNTGRIKQLLKLYPNAKFLYIYRNPISVFYSTQRFFTMLYPTLWLHKVDQPHIDNMIIEVYKMIMQEYLDTKHLIPSKNLLEIKYEYFEKQPIEALETVYKELFSEDFTKAKPVFEKYLETQKRHKTNSYNVSKISLEKVQKEWAMFMELYDYNLPPEVNPN